MGITWVGFFNIKELYQSCNLGKLLQCWKILGMLPSSRFEIQFFSTLFNTIYYLRVFFSAVTIVISKESEIFNHKFLIMITKTFFLIEGQAVWRMSQKQFWFLIILRKKSVKNLPPRKLELLSPQNRYIGHQGSLWKIKGIPIFLRKGILGNKLLFRP